MLGESVIIVVYSVSMYRTIVVPVGNHMAMMLADGVLESEPKIIMASIASCRFRCSHKYSLQRKRNSCRQHYDDGDPPKNMVLCITQYAISTIQLQ